MHAPDLKVVLQHASRLNSLLTDEFEALKTQKLDAFESLQQEKIDLLQGLKMNSKQFLLSFEEI